MNAKQNVIQSEKRSKTQMVGFTLEMRCRYPSSPFLLFCFSPYFFRGGGCLMHCRVMALQSTSAKTASVVIHPL